MSEENPQQAEAKVRSYLAAERTFAAWVRTGISLIILGLAIARFLAIRNDPFKLYFLIIGGSYVLEGIALLIFAAVDYFQRRDEIRHSHYHAPKKTLIAIVGSMSLLTVFLMVVLVIDLTRSDASAGAPANGMQTLLPGVIP